MSAPEYAFYGDDFTGATDTLAQLSRAGLRTLLFLGIPDEWRLRHCGELDAIGIAGAARSMAPEAMRAELNAVGARFASLGVKLVHYKVCSTFDSAPQVGSIGVALQTLRAYCANPLRVIVGGQPDLRRYCVFGQLFAASGADERAPVYRIDRHPTMRAHPVTPMHEADLRAHLREQGVKAVTSVDWRALALEAKALSAHVNDALREAPDALLFDVQDAAHLRAIGGVMRERAALAPLLAVGASSVAQAWAHSAALHDHADTSAIGAAQGPVFVLAGSLSPRTAAQIEAANAYVRVRLDPARMTGDAYLAAQIAAIGAELARGHHVLAYTDRTRVEGAASPADNALARACGALLDGVLKRASVRRVGVAGGDTSSFAVRALDAWALSYRATLAPGVALCRLHADDARLDGIELMLKGGQMGDVDLFARLARGT
ncbi:four-carbon acid sugar kinase family protein [Paraburkholderia acidisoli]|uniref:Four-carbon acid sugar kinase family protein n=1 Tax=Paraburkholderia acidisoli TaxID=2571748 RepID=A0A7Z2JK25_9BURK|nr:four-carbon acid sugar kinase family protein [Paraburkholderia acidisoli]QGZ65990.1 four-carbon acid sugar kinase family protein [Paraburkholderia acidisoli]